MVETPQEILDEYIIDEFMTNTVVTRFVRNPLVEIHSHDVNLLNHNNKTRKKTKDRNDDM